MIFEIWIYFSWSWNTNSDHIFIHFNEMYINHINDGFIYFRIFSFWYYILYIYIWKTNMATCAIIGLFIFESPPGRKADQALFRSSFCFRTFHESRGMGRMDNWWCDRYPEELEVCLAVSWQKRGCSFKWSRAYHSSANPAVYWNWNSYPLLFEIYFAYLLVPRKSEVMCWFWHKTK